MQAESPRKKRQESSQSVQEFLKHAKLIDARDERQQLFFLEHDWTVARALKVRPCVEITVVSQVLPSFTIAFVFALSGCLDCHVYRRSLLTGEF